MKDTNEALRELYAAAQREEAPSLEDRRSVRRAVLAAAVITNASVASAAAAKVAASPVMQAITITKVLGSLGIGFALGAVTSVGVQALGPEPSPILAATPALPVEPRGGGRSASRRTPAVSADATSRISSAAPVVLEAEAPALPRRAGGETALAPQNTAPTSMALPSARPSLDRESGALLSVQSALKDGEPERALRLLDAQEAEFQGGALAEERAAARVVALCAAGRPEEGENARKRFIATFPGSPLTQRVLATCSEQ